MPVVCEGVDRRGALVDHICEIAEDLLDYPPNRRVRVDDHHRHALDDGR
jgi:hypothetical protein